MSSVSRSVGRPVTRSVLAGQLNNLTQLIKSLFSLGEQGFAYDPNDLTTLYQDAAGTVPVTGAGQPVGLVKDKSGRNNHAFQTISTSRALLGRHPDSGARNLFLYSNGFSESTWTKGQALLATTPSIVAPDGSFTATKLIEGTQTNAYHQLHQTYTAANNTTPVTFSFYVKAAERTKVNIMTNWSTVGHFDLANGTATGVGRSITPVGNGWYRCSITGTPPDITARTYVVQLINNSGLEQYTGDGVSGIYVWGGQLEVGSVATPWQETKTLLDITEKGKFDCWYLKPDGVDDFLVIAKDNLKFLHDGTGSSVFIGYTPLSSTYHTLLSSGYLASTGSIGYTLSQDDRSGSGAILNIITNGNGTSHVANNVGATGITTKPRVVTTKNKVGTHIIRHNALQILNNPTETGIASTAPSSYDVRIGNSAAGFPMTGHIYSLIGISRLTTDAETLALEKAIAKATGVTLNV